MNNTFSEDHALNRDILIFTKRLLALVKLGSKISSALAVVGQDEAIESKHLKLAAANMARDIVAANNTKSFPDLLAEHPRLFSPFYVELVKIGWETHCDNAQIFSELLSVYGFERQLDTVRKH